MEHKRLVFIRNKDLLCYAMLCMYVDFIELKRIKISLCCENMRIDLILFEIHGTFFKEYKGYILH